jgi:hypothetical protein
MQTNHYAQRPHSNSMYDRKPPTQGRIRTPIQLTMTNSFYLP